MKRELVCQDCVQGWFQLKGRYAGEHVRIVSGLLREDVFVGPVRITTTTAGQTRTESFDLPGPVCDQCMAGLDRSGHEIAYAVSVWKNGDPNAYDHTRPWELEYFREGTLGGDWGTRFPHT